jgi:aspartate aminotransferase
MPVSKKMTEFIKRSSWIRAMFEEGAKLKAKYGAENVYDFSLGNPNLEPPERFFEVAKKCAEDRSPGRHAYMPNSGFPAVRAKMAEHLGKQQGVSLNENHIIMTVGAGGGLNVAFKALCNQGDEVVVPTPYFVEYDFYADNHGGSVKRVAPGENFSLNIPAIAEALSERTCAILINTPNNPSGALYSRDELKALAQVLTEAGQRVGRPMYLISDEPYRQIVFDGAEVPSIMDLYDHSIVCSSFSKNISLPGERIGYLAINPKAADAAELIGGMTMANRILGFVNAPAFMQWVVAELLDETSDLEQYAKKRDLFRQVMDHAGFEYFNPKGSFYFFPKSPIEDDVAFVRTAQEENVLVVPGSGFAGPGHFRAAFCCDDATIERSAPAFKRLRERY